MVSDVAKVLATLIARHELVWLTDGQGVEVAVRCGFGSCEFSTDDLSGAQERHLAAVLEAEVIRPREREAWAKGCAEGKRLGEWGLPGLPNPFTDEGGEDR